MALHLRPELYTSAGVVRTLRRWTTFNVVGLAGVAVQLGMLAALVHAVHMPYLLATAIAVEAAVLHNFAWHQRWTWRDRPAGSRRALVFRLGRFHLLNGAISLAGNLALMGLLTGLLHLPVLPANVLAVVACSLLNFAASERAVFRAAAVGTATMLVLLSSPATSAAQSQETIATWNAYQAKLDARYAAAGTGGSFFAQDLSGTAGWRARARDGGAILTEIDAPSVPGGRIHHWVGTVWVPGVSVPGVIEHLERGAGNEAMFYEDVIASRLLARDGDRLRVYMKLRRQAIVTVTYNTEHVVAYRRLGASRASSRSVATRIAELEHAGQSDEREKRSGDDNGFLWRLLAYWRYEEFDGGVLIECESVTLSRPVPLLLRPIAAPIIDRIARESLERTLTTLRGVLRSAH